MLRKEEGLHFYKCNAKPTQFRDGIRLGTRNNHATWTNALAQGTLALPSVSALSVSVTKLSPRIMAQSKKYAGLLDLVRECRPSPQTVELTSC